MPRQPQRVIASFSGAYGFLGNFHPCKVVYDGLEYRTSEHAFQAAKTEKVEVRRRIQDAGTPSMAKFIGGQLQLRSGWNEMRRQVMKDVVRAKFEQNPILRRALFETGDAVLVEGNKHNDRDWGACRGKKEGLPKWITPRGPLYGHNWLGIILMELREEMTNGD